MGLKHSAVFYPERKFEKKTYVFQNLYEIKEQIKETLNLEERNAVALRDPSHVL